MPLFQFDKALEAAKNDPFVGQFLTANKDRLITLGQEAGLATINGILDLFAAQKFRDGLNAFYGTASLGDIATGSAADVTGTAAMAQRAADLKAELQKYGTLAVQALLSILVAGFLA